MRCTELKILQQNNQQSERQPAQWQKNSARYSTDRELKPRIYKDPKKLGQVLWITSEVPTTWEAEMRGSWFETNTGRRGRGGSQQGPISKNKLGMVVYICNFSYAGSMGRRIMVQRRPRLKA
jgi:hypothetical protein